MEELRIENSFILEDFIDMEEIEHTYFLEENITPAKEVLKWYQKNPYTCIGIRDKNNKIIASVNVLPLKKEIFDDIYHNKFKEADITEKQIEIYEENKSYYLYLSAISIKKEYRNNIIVFKMLLKSIVQMFKELERKQIKIEGLLAEASTIHGEKLCKRMLNMKFIESTNHESDIYHLEGKNIEKIINCVKKMLEK